MKKNALIALSMIMLSVFSFTFTSCGDDDDDEEPVITTPKYSEDAVRYEIKGTSDIASIEFTESGMYVITKKGKSAAKGFGKFFKGKSYKSITRSEDDDYEYIHGKYTKNGDVYTLEGFGTITVVKKEDVNVSLQIQQTGKKAYTLSAQPVKKFKDSDITNKLCRTWKFEKGRLVVNKVNKGDSVVLDKTSPKISVLLTSLDSVWNEFYPIKYSDYEEITFTKSGSYIIKYTDNTIAVAQWKWKDEKKGTMYYSWENWADEEGYEEEPLEISFNDNDDLVIDKKEDNVRYTEKFTYYLSKTK